MTKVFLCTLAAVALSYLAAAFALWDFNPANWGTHPRVTTLFIMFTAGAGAGLASWPYKW